MTNLLDATFPHGDDPRCVEEVARADAKRQTDQDNQAHQWQAARAWAHLVEAETQGRTQR